MAKESDMRPTENPATRSIFDLLEEKYSSDPIPASAASAIGRRPIAAYEAEPETGLDGGSRSLLLASLVAVLATALVTLSLKPDLPSAIADVSPAIGLHADRQADAAPTSEIGIQTLPAPSVAPEPMTVPERRPAAEPAAVATLTLAKPKAEPAEIQQKIESPRRETTSPISRSPAPSIADLQPAEPSALPAPVTEAVSSTIESAATEKLPEMLPERIAENTFPEPAPLDQAPEEAIAPIPTAQPETPVAPVAVANVDPPVRLVTPLPSYTQDAWVAGIQGDVLVRARIDKEGTVADVQVLRGLSHGLTEAAVAAVRRWRFRPANIDGEPVSFDHDLSIRFTL